MSNLFANILVRLIDNSDHSETEVCDPTTEAQNVAKKLSVLIPETLIKYYLDNCTVLYFKQNILNAFSSPGRSSEFDRPKIKTEQKLLI